MTQEQMSEQNIFDMFDMTEEQVERDVKAVESETESDELTGRVWYGLHLNSKDQDMTTISLRLPKADLARITANAKKFHLSRSEYIRRHLARA